jgi:hypothetical protein
MTMRLRAVLNHALPQGPLSVRWHTGWAVAARATFVNVARAIMRMPVCADVPTRFAFATTLSSVHPSVNRLPRRGAQMNSIVYLVGAIVIIVAVLSFFGLR